MGKSVDINGNFVVEGLQEQMKQLDALLASNPEMEAKMRRVISKVMVKAQKWTQKEIAGDMPNDPRHAAKAVRKAVYRRILGGNINILRKSRATEAASNYTPTRTLKSGQRGGNRRLRSERTHRMDSYNASDRGFILYWLNSGTGTRQERGFRKDPHRSDMQVPLFPLPSFSFCFFSFYLQTSAAHLASVCLFLHQRCNPSKRKMQGHFVPTVKHFKIHLGLRMLLENFRKKIQAVMRRNASVPFSREDLDGCLCNFIGIRDGGALPAFLQKALAARTAGLNAISVIRIFLVPFSYIRDRNEGANAAKGLRRISRHQKRHRSAAACADNEDIFFIDLVIFQNVFYRIHNILLRLLRATGIDARGIAP